MLAKILHQPLSEIKKLTIAELYYWNVFLRLEAAKSEVASKQQSAIHPELQRTMGSIE